MAEDQHIYTHPEPPGVRVKLERGQKGGVGWEVTATAATVEATLALIRAADAALRAEYATDEKGA